MPSQFFGLNIAYKGMLASNAALTTTANNISNVQTDGYSRQQVLQQASTPLRVFQTYGCAGAGVETLAVERVRDEFYDGKFWRSNTTAGEYQSKQYYMGQIETYFDDDGKNAGFKTIFDQFTINSMEELMKNPGNDKTKAQFVGSAGNLTEYFNGLAGNLANLQRDLNLEIKAKVDEITGLAGQIATLNTQINTIEIGNDVQANELRDRRTLLLDQLSVIVDIQVSDIPIQDPYYPERNTGATRLMVRTAGGQILVDGNDYRGLECRARKDYEKVNQTDIDGLYDIYWKDGQEFNLYNASMKGQLKGLIDMRDGNNGEEFYGKVTGIGTYGDGRDTVTVEVSEHYLQDLNKCNLSDTGGNIVLGNHEYYYDTWSCTIGYDGKGNQTYSYTFVLSDDTQKNPNPVTADRVGERAQVGYKLEYQGIPYYMKQMNEWVRTYAQKFNDILNSGYDSYNQEACNLFTGNKNASKDQYSFPGAGRYDLFTKEVFDAGGSFTVSSEDDSYLRLTALNFTVLQAAEVDPDLVANKFRQGDGTEQNDLIRELQKMGTDKTKMNFRGSCASEFLQCMMSDVALNASSANRFYTCNKEITDAIDTQRISISGVDEDEEAVNLVKYQNAYNLSAKMIQIFTEIYDKLIQETGV